MLKQLLILSLFLFPILAQANTPLNQSYIEQHRQIAVNEMQWSGIPASIKLAQAILESSWGRSKAATIYNSHFGIKCKDWQGDTFRKKDDDYDTYGNLIESCFRAYTSTEQSFRDHSNFLLTGNRYQELFTYDRSDYVNWAIGLQRCGYATDPEYALRLIDLIEKYKLYEYDGYKMASTATAMQPIAPRVNTPGATTVPQQHDRYHATDNGTVYLPPTAATNATRTETWNTVMNQENEAPSNLAAAPPADVNQQVILTFRPSYDRHYRQLSRKPRVSSSRRR